MRKANRLALKPKKAKRLTGKDIAAALNEANDAHGKALGGLLGRVPLAVKEALSAPMVMGGIERGGEQSWRATPVADEAANDAPSAEQIAWERGRMEGRAEARNDLRRRRVLDFIAMVDSSRESRVRFVQLGLDFAQDIVEALWAAGYGENGKASQPKG